MRLFRREQADRAFEAQREALRSNESPGAAAHLDFQAEHGLDAPVPAHPLDRARVELERLDKRIEYLDGQIDYLHERQRTPGHPLSGLDRSRLARLEAERSRLEPLATKLWAKVHPPLIDGDTEYKPLPVCKAGCGTTLDRSEVFERMGYCPPCYEVATGRAQPPSPDADTARINELLARLP